MNWKRFDPLSAGGLLLVLSAFVGSPVLLAQTFNQTGSYSIAYNDTTSTTLSYKWTVGVTYPTNGSGPFPLIVMFNGMECQAPWYTEIVNHVASWGYVVLQYTTGFAYPLVNGETDEVKYLFDLLEWLKRPTAANWTSISEKIDFNRKAVMGHSRGGKLASLHYANRTNNFVTAVLIDPVDCSTHALGSSHPSAISALAGMNDVPCTNGPRTPHGRGSLSAAIVAAGITGMCNPTDNNAEAFYGSVSTRSLYVNISEAGHMTFPKPKPWTPGWIAYHAIDRACGHHGGNIDQETVISEAKTMAVAWFESVFRPSPDTTMELAAYKQHLVEQRDAFGILTFEWPEVDGWSSSTLSRGSKSREASSPSSSPSLAESAPTETRPTNEEL